jgi:hypothetical protein
MCLSPNTKPQPPILCNSNNKFLENIFVTNFGWGVCSYLSDAIYFFCSSQNGLEWMKRRGQGFNINYFWDNVQTRNQFDHRAIDHYMARSVAQPSPQHSE